MKRILLLIPLLLTALAPTRVLAAELVPHRAEYRIKISVLSGRLETQVYAAGDAFLARSVITPTGFASVLKNGSIVEQSEFTIGANGVQPLLYESVDSLSKDEKAMNFAFDWDTASVAGEINEEAFRFELDGEAHDRVTIQYELMYNLLNGIDTREYKLLDGDELKDITIRNIGRKEVRVPFGRFEAVGIQHSARNSSRVSTLWCVEELGYLPVIIEQHRKGKLRVRAVLTDYVPLFPDDAPAVAAGSPN